MHEWSEVFQSENTLVVQFKARILQFNGIKTLLRNENLAALVGMGGLGLPCQLFVPTIDLEKAGELLKKSDGPRLISSSDAPKECPHCQAPWEIGFDICWQCEQ